MIHFSHLATCNFFGCRFDIQWYFWILKIDVNTADNEASTFILQSPRSNLRSQSRCYTATVKACRSQTEPLAACFGDSHRLLHDEVQIGDGRAPAISDGIEEYMNVILLRNVWSTVVQRKGRISELCPLPTAFTDCWQSVFGCVDAYRVDQMFIWSVLVYFFRIQ